ncbi:MAG: hypothetical protein LBJ82_03510 [Deltaproteobacteria bacterium]|jgi:hypothetical protein|nr:hypothetical protein [Deltaproteobacteria bacterium]
MPRQSVARTAFICLILACFLGACVPAAPLPAKKDPHTLDTPIPRADPGYIQQLERKSMLNRAAETAKVVTGSELAWRAPAGYEGPDAMLGLADIWVSIHPLTFLSSARRTVFEQLGESSIWPIFREIGARGIYVAPIFGSGELWSGRAPGGLGDDMVQFSFAPAAGQESHYRRLMHGVIDNQNLLGSDLTPAATGIGPDFFLAARNYREFPGIYCIIEIPRQFWPLLPKAPSAWEGAPLSEQQIASLNAAKLLPLAMRLELSFPEGRSGWAATGEIVGIDAVTRRWAYRYFKDPQHPVLNWEDPTRAASRILSSSVVQQVGIWGQAFIGLRLDAFHGLEAVPSGQIPLRTPGEDAVEESYSGENSPGEFFIEPALPAAQSLSREIRRYGGWSWLRGDALPLPALREFLRAGTDFVQDAAFSPAAEHALLTGDASLLRFMADEVLRLKIDTRRMVQTMPAEEGLNYALPHLRWLAAGPGGETAAALLNRTLNELEGILAKQSPVPFADGVLYTTGTGLAALALGLPLDAPESPGGPPHPSVREDLDRAIRDKEKILAGVHTLLIFFKAMQPGALMLTGQDIVGALPLSWSSLADSAAGWDVRAAARGGYALTSSGAGLIVSPQGLPRATALYPPADRQVLQEDSFLRRVGSFLRLRSQLGIARGAVIARLPTSGQGSIALLSRMSGQERYLLSVCNFSRSRVRESLSLDSLPGTDKLNARITPLGTHSANYVLDNSTLVLELGGWEGKAFFIGDPRQP